MLTAAQMLEIWEKGLGLPVFETALLLLQAAFPDRSADELAELTIGQRDALLLELRELTFGRVLACLIPCPACSERMELVLNTADIKTLKGSLPIDNGTSRFLRYAEFDVEFRLPNSRDLQAISGSMDIEESRKRLLDRCLIAVYREGALVAVPLPPAAIEAVAEKMSELDPLGHTELAITCSECGHGWQALFDITTYFWKEIQSWAMGTLREVHVLATAYGWQEDDILAMNPLRRRLYLEMVSP